MPEPNQINATSEFPEINAADFARRFSLRAERLMWFLGAGASAAAGIPTAFDMIWEFKQQLFVSERRTSPQSVADLSNAEVRARLQAHIDSAGNFPLPNAPDEYAVLFEAVWPSESDRRSYLDSKIAGAKPSYGHLALATLMKARRARLVWTTNFDPLVADACAKVYEGTGALTTGALDAPDLARQSIAAERWPLEVKLHGDFRSRRLKNIPAELRHQDQHLRQLLIECTGRFGLVVVGYSGRDDSIMNTLQEAVERSSPFPAGLFWLHRGEDPPLPRVCELLRLAAKRLGNDAALVRVENFDEVLRDLVRIVKGASSEIDTRVLDAFATERRWWTAAPRHHGKKGWPVLRLNALQVEAPTVCRLVSCKVGGYSDVRDAVEKAGVNVLTARRKQGVLAFGSDADVRAAFNEYGITEFELQTIDVKRLRYESAERGLLREALSRALARARKMDRLHRRTEDLLAPADPKSAEWKQLRELTGSIEGVVEGVEDLRWREGIAIRLDWADDRLWLLFEPKVVFNEISLASKHAASDFGRERSVRRYNRQLNDLVVFWAGLLAGDGSPFSTLGIADGVDAVFKLSRDTAFSWRAV